VAAVISLPRLLVIAALASGSRLYRLEGVFVVRFSSLADGTIFAENGRTSTHAYGETYREAYDAFSEAFDVQWRSLVEVDPASLTEHAQGIRARLRAAVTEIINLG
jgi:hypothetical protein